MRDVERIVDFLTFKQFIQLYGQMIARLRSEMKLLFEVEQPSAELCNVPYSQVLQHMMFYFASLLGISYVFVSYI